MVPICDTGGNHLWYWSFWCCDVVAVCIIQEVGPNESEEFVWARSYLDLCGHCLIGCSAGHCWQFIWILPCWRGSTKAGSMNWMKHNFLMKFYIYVRNGNFKLLVAHYIFNGMLFSLLIMHIYWFYLICKIAVNAIKNGEAKDEREDWKFLYYKNFVEELRHLRNCLFRWRGLLLSDSPGDIARSLLTLLGRIALPFSLLLLLRREVATLPNNYTRKFKNFNFWIKFYSLILPYLTRPHTWVVRILPWLS